MSDIIDIFFATNRNLDSEDPPIFGETFHKDGAECYRVGQAHVKRVDGEYKLHQIDVARESGSGEDSEVVLGSTQILREMKELMQQGDRDAIVLLHGYASDLATAAERAAELTDKYLVRGKDGVERHPVVFVFSWPANGRTIPFKSYVSDRSDAARSGQAIARLFMRLCDFLTYEARDLRRAGNDETARDRHAPCTNRIHLVAHSMGNWALRHALKCIIETRGADWLPALFDNIFLMAADDDDDTLNNPEKLGLLTRIGNAVHVYHSKDDQALVISEVTKLNPDRLGSNGPVDMQRVDQKIVAVDCRHVDFTTILHANHQYYRRRPEVIADVRQVLAGRVPGNIDNRRRLDHPSRYMIMSEVAIAESRPIPRNEPHGRR